MKFADLLWGSQSSSGVTILGERVFLISRCFGICCKLTRWLFCWSYKHPQSLKLSLYYHIWLKTPSNDFWLHYCLLKPDLTSIINRLSKLLLTNFMLINQFIIRCVSMMEFNFLLWRWTDSNITAAKKTWVMRLKATHIVATLKY